MTRHITSTGLTSTTSCAQACKSGLPLPSLISSSESSSAGMEARQRKGLVTLLLFLLFLLILPVLTVVTIFAYGLKLLLTLTVYVTEPSIIRIVGPKDAVWLTSRFNLTPSKPYPDSFIEVAVVLDGRVSVRSIQDWLQKELVDRKAENGELMYPELQQIQVRKYGHWWWKWDKDFRIGRHVRLHEDSQGWELTTGTQFQSLIGRAGMQYIDMGHPLWEFLVVNNYVDGPEDSEPKTALIIRLCHSYWDGFSALKMIQQAAKCKTDWIPVYKMPPRTWWEKVEYYAYVLYQSPYNAYRVGTISDKNLLTCRRKSLRHEFVSGMTGRIPLRPVKALKDKYGISFQGVMLAACTKAFAKYREAKEGAVREGDTVHTFSPFPWPGHPQRICNHWTMGCHESRLVSPDTPALAHLLREDRISKEVTGSSMLVTNFWLFEFLGIFSPELTAGCANIARPTFGLSNMKGPPEELLMAGHIVKDIMFWLPLTFPGMSVTVFSYKDSFRLGLGTDKRICRDGKALTEFLDFLRGAVEEFVSLGSEVEPIGQTATFEEEELEHGIKHRG